MSKEDSNTVAFTYLGTAETLFDLKIFGDFVRTVDPRPRQEVQEEYNRHFSNGVNFTFIQHEECAIQPPMDWEEEDTYDGGNFRLLRPVEDLNPYTRLKIGRITRSQRQYEFHVFYRRSQAVFDFDVLETVMSRLDKSFMVRELLQLRYRAHIALTQVEESTLPSDVLSHLDEYAHEKDIEDLLRRRDFEAGDSAVLAQVASIYQLFGHTRYLKALASAYHSQLRWWEDANRTKEENLVEMENLLDNFSSWAP